MVSFGGDGPPWWLGKDPKGAALTAGWAGKLGAWLQTRPEQDLDFPTSWRLQQRRHGGELAIFLGCTREPGPWFIPRRWLHLRVDWVVSIWLPDGGLVRPARQRALDFRWRDGMPEELTDWHAVGTNYILRPKHAHRTHLDRARHATRQAKAHWWLSIEATRARLNPRQLPQDSDLVEELSEMLSYLEEYWVASTAS